MRADRTTSELTGRGLSFPLQLGVSGFSESSGVAKVNQAIRIILGTRPGQRLMRPDFGCLIQTLAFAPNTPATANLACFYVTESLTRWEPRIELVSVEATNDLADNQLVVEIRYRLRATRTIRDFAFPFSLERAR
jgi:uncharacterized protein